MNDYQEYYNLYEVLALGEQKDAYDSTVKTLEVKLPEILDKSRPMTYVLGGFHGGNSTPKDFVDFFKKYHNRPDDKYIYFDMNKTPLITTGAKDVNALKIQGRLENPPFANNSLDWMILDRTLDFMNDTQVKGFANEISSSLKQNGIIIATIQDPILPFLVNWRFQKANRVEQHIRTAAKLKKLIKGSLKTVFHGDAELDNGQNYSILAFSRKDSKLDEFKGASTDLTTQNESAKSFF